MIPRVTEKYRKFRVSFSTVIRSMLDVTSDKYEVWLDYDKILFYWLVRDGSNLDWDRVTMVSATPY